MSSNNTITHEVPASRLVSGEWSHDLDRQIGEGDIHASYSADRIGMGQPIRPPFTYQGSQWVCVSIWPGPTISAYRLVDYSVFPGTPVSYNEKVRANHGDDARADPLGFHHGMIVTSAGKEMVLCGPKVRFVGGPEQQLSLF